MKKLSFFAAMAIIAIAISFNSCSKGTAGPTGPTGATGATGATGPAGTSGSSSITDTIINLQAASWQENTPQQYFCDLSMPPITNSNTDVVIVYTLFEFNAGDYVTLPQSSVFVNGDEVSCYFTKGAVMLFYSNPASGAPTKSETFKIVIIPPSIIKQNPNTNWKDYSQVMAIEEQNRARN
ncbi:MAG: hypothetical protein ACLQQ4_14785 [Bacteroidia bacterium]